MNDRAQSIVEFALVLPLLMVLLLGFGELAFLFASRQAYQNGVDVLVDWAASEMSSSPGESWQMGWGAVVGQEAARTKCSDDSPSMSFPDGTHDAGDRVLLRWDCLYVPHFNDDLRVMVSVESEAVVPGFKTPAPSPS